MILVIDPVKRLEFIANLLPAGQSALDNGCESWSYQQLIAKIDDCRQWLVQLPGDVIAFQLENGLDWVLLDLACQTVDKTLIPIPAFFSAGQLENALRASGAELFIADHSLAQNAEAQAWVEQQGQLLAATFRSLKAWHLALDSRRQMPEGTTKITFTSGSTGHSKGVCLSAEHPWRVAQSLADTLKIKQPRHLCLLPLPTLLENIAGVYSPLLSGGTVLVPGDEARGLSGSCGLNAKQILSCISRFQPNTLILIPQLLTLLVQARLEGWQAPSSLEFIAVGGARVAPDLIATAHQLGLPVYQGYGLSECGSVVALNTPERQRQDTVGPVLPHCRVTIEQGEIRVSGCSHLGYLGDPLSWYPQSVSTGDQGTMSEGFLAINGRLKNLLITSFGRNVSPEWVESELLATPLLTQVQVFGDARPYLVALLAAPEQISDAAIDGWINVVNQSLPDYARILRWQRLAESEFQPFMTANGRLQRQRLQRAKRGLIEQMYLQAILNSEDANNDTPAQTGARVVC